MYFYDMIFGAYHVGFEHDDESHSEACRKKSSESG